MRKKEKIKIIIKKLVDNNDYTTVKTLSECSGYSARSIYSLLQSSEFLTHLYGAQIEKKPNKGIRIIANKKQKEKIYSYLNVDFSPLVPEDNNAKHTILLLLLKTNQTFTVDEIATKIYRSKTSTFAILDEVSSILERYHCRLIKKPNLGISIDGEEENLREIYFKLIQQLPVNQISKSNLDQRLSNQLYSQMISVFHSQFISDIEEIVRNIEINLNTNFCDYDFGSLILRLAIFVDRTRHHAFVATKNKLNNNIQEYYVAMMTKMMIEQKFHYTLPSYEIYEIERMLLAMRKQINPQQIQSFNEVVIDSFVNLVSEHLNADLTNDRQLHANLIDHLKPAIRRIKYGVSSENPLMEQIREKYTEVYVAIITTIDQIEEQENVVFDANELGYICLHIVAALNRSKRLNSIHTLLICDSGITFESYLKSSIESMFSELKINKICNYEKYCSIDSSSYDLILNTSSYRIHKDNVVNIDQLLSEESNATIRHWIYAREFNDNRTLSNMFQDYLLYFQENYCKTQQELVEKYCAFLVNNGYVTKEYQTSVIERMRLSATAIGRGVAVTHGAKKYVKNSIILIIRLQTSINWENQPADLILFAAIGNDVNKEYSEIFRRIVRIVSDNEKTYALKHCSNIEEIKKLLFE